MIKRFFYLCCGILGVVSTFFAYATIGYKYVDGVPAFTKDAINGQLEENGNSVITFFEKIGDFRDESFIKNHVDTILSSLLVAAAVICASIILVSAILAIIKKNNKIFKLIEIKWVSVIGFGSLLISLLIGLIINRLPDSPMPLVIVKYTQGIGLGSLMFLIATGASSAISFITKKN